MKILLVINTLKIGGAETFVVNLANFLTSKSAEDVYLLNLNLNNFENDNPLESNLSINKNKYIKKQQNIFFLMNRYRITRKIYTMFFRKAYSRYLVNKTKSLILKIRPDIIISFLIGSDRIIHQSDLKIPHIIVDQGDYRIEFSDRTILLNKCNNVVCVSESNKILMNNYYKKPNVKVIYNGYHNNSSFSLNNKMDFNIPENAFVFVMCARGIKEKGWMEGAIAFSKMKHFKESYLVLIGDGPAINDVKEFTRIKCFENIRFTGFLSNPAEFIRISDVAILPSYFVSESLPLSLVESLYFQKPLIATNIGGIPEIIRNSNGDCGILIELVNGRPDIETLSTSMDYLFENKNMFKENIINCNNKFLLENTAQQYIKLCYATVNL